MLRIIAAADGGRALNPQAFLGQVEGGMVMGIGTALKEAYDQIIMDVSLPDISGIDCMVAILEQDPQARILLVTGHNAANIESSAPESSGVEILTKPLDLADLSERMAALARSLG